MHSPYMKFSAPSPIRIGGATWHPAASEVTGEHVMLDGEPYICIRNVDALKPFFMSIVSNGDLWIFAGSNTPFTAGRSSPESAIFPYQTVDKILQSPDSSGAMTLFLVRHGEGASSLWEPWRPLGRLYHLTRNLYKHASGSVVVFEEINHDLALRWRWSLTASDEFGLVRSCEIGNLSPDPVTVKYLDGWHHLLPAGVSQETYARFSYLAAAYMRHERRDNSVLGIYTLNSRISDRAEPGESLRASCAWALGHAHPAVLLSTRQVDAFLHDAGVRPETEVRGDFGAYLVADQTVLSGDGRHEWITVADTGLDHAALVALERKLASPGQLEAELQASVSANLRGLRQRIAAADGLQETADASASVHHFSNVLFNCMRGGTFTDSYSFPSADFEKFLKSRSTIIHARHRVWLGTLPEKLTLAGLGRLAAKQDDVQLNRLAREYLPLTFSRRHGDPSRPWNRFVIRVKNERNEIVYDYQGNWRDIFQNWESLAGSYPEALGPMIAVFLNASTADGYNPYRVARGGIDWEVLDHADPWSHIGYWGDHQLIYLLRLLTACEKHYPGRLASQLDERLYAFTLVPYEIRGFDAIVRDPGNSIAFNDELHRSLLERAEKIGNDAKLLSDGDEVVLVSLAEKLLVPLLAKLSNLVPEGGIWMNTQRPDWNDANNALVGWGLSMVTVYQMRQYIRFIDGLFASFPRKTCEVSVPVAEFAAELTMILERAAGQLPHEPAERYAMIEALGRAGEKHRAAVYRGGLKPVVALSVSSVRELFACALAVTDVTIRSNRREDGMYHSYNLLQVRAREAGVKRLQLMLEGQVNAISSGLLPPGEVLAVLEALSKSDLYRPDQHSYMLYPDREIEPFLLRNTLPKNGAVDAPLLGELVAAGHRDIVVVDGDGRIHFQADMTNASDLNARLDRLALSPQWKDAVARDRMAITHLWEEVFEHSTFLGRSGTMFAFEGLGSIYWHMVAKLLLAVQENFQAARKAGAGPEILRALGGFYFEVRKGLGFTKSPQVYGAFPSDPYSHSPGHLGAQQPGMTGQVKEEILTRWGELGLEVDKGALRFDPHLLRQEEFFADKHAFVYLGLDGVETTWNLPTESLAFTYCQVPVCYQLADAPSIVIERGEGTVRIEGNVLPPADSEEIFARTGSILRLVVQVPRPNLFR